MQTKITHARYVEEAGLSMRKNIDALLSKLKMKCFSLDDKHNLIALMYLGNFIQDVRSKFFIKELVLVGNRETEVHDGPVDNTGCLSYERQQEYIDNTKNENNILKPKGDK